jgi:serine protease Do
MKNNLKLFVVAVGASLLTMILYVTFVERPKEVTIINQNQAVPGLRMAAFADGTGNFTEAAELTVNAVVHVKTSAQRTVPQFSNPLEELFFGAPRARAPQVVTGSGSGVIMSENGYIITNNHVIDKADKITVTLNDNREYEATVVGTDPATDIALLKISDKNLPHLAFSNSDDLRLGEWVLAVGNPFNLTSTVTAGIVSALGRNINIIPDQAAIEAFIQTDAAVNPGNSGGALVNTSGQLVGINTAISSNRGSYVGYSFAVPSNIVKKVVEDLIEFGIVQRAFLGVQINDVTQQLVDELDLKVSAGVYVAGVSENGAAAEAGIKRGDVIVKINDRQVRRASELQESVGRQRPGDKVKVTVMRKNKTQELEVTLRNKQGDTGMVTNTKTTGVDILGASFETLSQQRKRELNVTHGVVVKKLYDGPLRKVKVPEGFIILKVNNQRVDDPETLNKIVSTLNPGDGILIQGVHPDGKSDYFAFGR